MGLVGIGSIETRTRIMAAAKASCGCCETSSSDRHGNSECVAPNAERNRKLAVPDFEVAPEGVIIIVTIDNLRIHVPLSMISGLSWTCCPYLCLSPVMASGFSYQACPIEQNLSSAGCIHTSSNCISHSCMPFWRFQTQGSVEPSCELPAASVRSRYTSFFVRHFLLFPSTLYYHTIFPSTKYDHNLQDAAALHGYGHLPHQYRRRRRAGKTQTQKHYQRRS